VGREAMSTEIMDYQKEVSREQQHAFSERMQNLRNSGDEVERTNDNAMRM